MIIHFVGGFLGSGKTTAITNAAKQLLKENIITGVVTNDQGKYLVDSKFISMSEIANVEVTGGCFCCNYDELDKQINVLKNKINPAIIFAESVGSCTDLIATVVKPMNQYSKNDIVTFSGFVDSQLLLRYLKGDELPFSVETNYIWEKQIEEAEILVINKFDLLDSTEINELVDLANLHFALKTLLFQNSLDEKSVQLWVETINKFNPEGNRKAIEVDYKIYGAGEANLAWLDEGIKIKSITKSAVESAFAFIDDVTETIANLKLPIGHLKFFLTTREESAKISITTVMGNSWKSAVKLNESYDVQLMINARIQSSPAKVRSIISDAVKRLKINDNIQIEENDINYFQPGFPNPTHRLVG